MQLTLILSIFLLVVHSLCQLCPTSHTISVQGTAKTTFTPNLATITFNANAKNSDPNTAWQQMEKITEKVKEKLELCSISEDDVSTDYLQLQLQYRSVYNETNQNYERIKDGYQATNSMSVKVRDIKNVGKVLNYIVDAGGFALNYYLNFLVKQINSLSFTLSDDIEKQLQTQLITEAVKDAKDKANLALEILDQKIVSVISVSLDQYSNYQPYQPVYKMAFDEVSTGGNIFSAGNQKKSLSVSVTFEIGNKE